MLFNERIFLGRLEARWPQPVGNNWNPLIVVENQNIKENDRKSMWSQINYCPHKCIHELAFLVEHIPIFKVHENLIHLLIPATCYPLPTCPSPQPHQTSLISKLSMIFVIIIFNFYAKFVLKILRADSWLYEIDRFF